MTDCSCANFPAGLGNVSFEASVGIGATNPGARLEIADNNALLLSSDTANLTLFLGKTGPAGSGYYYLGQGPATTEPLTVFSPTSGSALGLRVRNAGGAYNAVEIYNNDSYGAVDSSNPLALQPSGGNVGIGTTSPGARLEINANNALLLSSDTADLTLTIAKTGPAGSGYYYLGQGAASTEPLTVFSPTNGSALGLRIRNSGGAFNAVNIYNNDSYGGIASTNPLALQPTGGYVGIGTTSPTQLLHLQGGSLYINGGNILVSGDVTTGVGAFYAVNTKVADSGGCYYGN